MRYSRIEHTRPGTNREVQPELPDLMYCVSVLKGVNMKFAILISVLLTSMILAACEKENNQQNAPKLFEDQRAMLDKAKNVANTLQQQSNEQKKDIDQQSQ